MRISFRELSGDTQTRSHSEFCSHTTHRSANSNPNSVLGIRKKISDPVLDPWIRNPELLIRIRGANLLRTRPDPDPTWIFLWQLKNYKIGTVRYLFYGYTYMYIKNIELFSNLLELLINSLDPEAYQDSK
jgi:hypothetical protein